MSGPLHVQKKVQSKDGYNFEKGEEFTKAKFPNQLIGWLTNINRRFQVESEKEIMIIDCEVQHESK
jgi:hypothetical protein